MSEKKEIPKEVLSSENFSGTIGVPFEEEITDIGSTISEVGAVAPDFLVQKIKLRLNVQESVETLMVEREEIIKQLEEALSYFSTEPQEISPEEVMERANFRGDWTALTRSRLEHPIGFVKYMLLKLRHIENLKSGKGGFLEKDTDFRQYVFDQIKQYESTIEHVFSHTHISLAEEKSKRSINLGVGKYGQRPTVFQDAVHRDGTPLDDHQKHIIESHEAGHGIREFVGTEGVDLRALIDMDFIPQKEKNYLTTPDELAERMSQLKNYFGLDPTENFTVTHLHYAREHYVSDTGLDNSMSVFFAGITKEREEHFIRLINELPI